jgi:hypothetical protein
VACAAVVAGAAVTAGTQIGSNGVEPAAAQVLEQAARADADRAKARAGRFFYTETLVSTTTQTGSGAFTNSQKTELWAGADGSGVQVAHPQEVAVPPAASPAPPSEGTTGSVQPGGAAPQAGAPVLAPQKKGATRVRRYRKGTIEPGELGSFDTSFRDSLLRQFDLTAVGLARSASNQPAFNAQLLAAVRHVVARLKPGGDHDEAVSRQAFLLVTGLLGQWGEPMTDRLRSALFRFAATLDGIEVDKNFSYRQRTGIALSSGNARIVLAPGTYALLATSYKLGQSETTIETLRTAVVNRPRERPAN